MIYNESVRTVQLFVTCLIDTFHPEIGEAVVEILERLGTRVDFPREQTCCGQPMFNAGLRRDAKQAAQHTLRVFEKTEGDVVIPSGSCAHMLRHNFIELFSDDPDWKRRAEKLAARTYEFTEYLVDVLGAADLGASWDGPLVYHPSCHLFRGLGVDRAPLALLQHVQGAEVRPLPEAEDCCGFGGIFSVEHPEISAQMLTRKLGNLDSTRATTMVVADTGCLMHLEGGLHRSRRTQEVLHIAQVLNAGGSRPHGNAQSDERG